MPLLGFRRSGKNGSRLPIVSMKDGKVFANSRDVADYFGKEHRNVLRDIDALIEGGVLNFELTPYINDQNGQTYRAFDMTRDGFTLLAMGFTGKQALQFKLQYIAAFNEMEKTVKATPAIPDFSDPVAAARAWADEMEAKRVTTKKTGPRLSSP